MSTDCPILVWMLSLNREYTKEEYDACHKVVDDCVQHIKIPYDPPNADTFRHDPHAPAAHDAPPPHTPRQMARNGATASRQMESTGLSRSTPDDMPPEKFLHSMIGYHLAYETSLCGMAMTQGIQRKIINIGLGIKQVAVEPRGVSVKTYTESMAVAVVPGGAATSPRFTAPPFTTSSPPSPYCARTSRQSTRPPINALTARIAPSKETATREIEAVARRGSSRMAQELPRRCSHPMPLLCPP
ncbi:hypothetical protein B0H14DRAFT_3859217 [Mycena olivaceomarginata]|nr:hypothetical protein B0H14DRAFT_3859217 [Mycena olivaceomarginata]